ncbi:MAG TPA: tetratricopeptide repeat protein, partial [Vicinamibacteria bacterium]
AGDPYNVWIKNTLDLLDTFPLYRETKSPRFRILVKGQESDVLAPLVSELAEEAYDTLARRYGYSPRTPIRVEVYADHADFSVRTVGLAGLGALGVCFGDVLAIDSPSAREKGTFNWGSTLWHELAHTFALEMTRHRVPRWFTEGLSVLEERRARPGWGDDVSLEFLLALKADKLLPVAELNNGFVRPTSPEQVPVSYYQASLVVERIEAEHGFGAILGLLKGYGDGRSTESLFESVLGSTTEAFDDALRAELLRRFAVTLGALRLAPRGGASPPRSRDEVEERAREDPGDFLAQLALGRLLFEEGKLDEAQPVLERARDLFPESTGEGSPRRLLAAFHEKRGDPRAAADELLALTATDETDLGAHVELAEALEAMGEPAKAAEVLGRTVYIDPLDPMVHARLAHLYSETGDRKKVVRAREAIVALHPVDEAEALFQLSLARLDAGDTAGARHDVLRALEMAPRFQRAQELLLRLHRGAEPKPESEAP